MDLALEVGFSATVARAVADAGAALIADITGGRLTTMLAERVFLLRLDRVEAAAVHSLVARMRARPVPYPNDDLVLLRARCRKSRLFGHRCPADGRPGQPPWGYE
ncbi:hypothetical protein [Nocardia rhizosphaerae]|uniref:Uncharacterized protein n=1 Tax=Nocardia rhizosphaerae TaxID=1691571 RepID=A0ABV8LAL8_9NOCA